MNKKWIIAFKTLKRGLVVISEILVLGVAAHYLFSDVLSERSDNTKVLIFAGNAVSGEQLPDVSIKFIQGKDNPDGEGVCQVMAGADGEASVELPYGEYTAQWSADGYYTCYQNVEVREKEVLLRKWLLPLSEGGAAYIFVEWGSERDIDLCVYCEQTGRCIGREAALEDAGSFSYGDNGCEKGYELVYLKDYGLNTYMVYAKTNDPPARHSGGSQDTGGMAVSIYTSDGLLYQKRPDRKKCAALWKCAYMNCGSIEEQNEYICDRSEYAWAARDKRNPELWIENTSVKAVEKYEYYGELYNMEIDKYDINGNHTAYYGYDSDGEMTYGYESEYDENGNRLTKYEYECEYKYESDGSYEKVLLATRYEYVYEDNGNRVIRLGYDSDGKLSGRYEHEYDGGGNLISNMEYDGDGILIFGEEYKYDRNGNELSYCIYGSDGIYCRWEREYDENNNEICCYEYDEDGSLIYTTESKYDENNFKIASCMYREDGSLEFEKEYNPNGNYISGRSYDEQGLLDWRSKYEYDKSGNLMAYYSYNGEGQMEEKIEYDIHGNQTVMEAYEDGILSVRYVNVFDEKENPIEYYEYRDGRLETKRVREFNENGECILCYTYNGDGVLEDRTTYDYVYEYDAVGGMKIFYYRINGKLKEKTITLFY